jgi:hypothetical protein
MDCGMIRSELVSFHFGEAAPETRGRVETHLLACAECLRAYLELKRSIEGAPTGADAGARSSAAERNHDDEDGVPSAAARERLRHAVALHIESARGRSRKPPLFAWREAWGAAAAVAAVILVAIVVAKTGGGSVRPPASPVFDGTAVDSVNPPAPTFSIL